MSSPIGTSPDSTFQTRLNRVAEKRAPIEAARPQVDVLPDWKENVRHPVSMAAAAAIGAIVALIVRLVQFRLTGAPVVGDGALLGLAIAGGAAIVASFLVLFVIGLREKSCQAAQIGGVVAMLCLMHNLVHSAPGLFNALVSPEWTQATLASTEPKSILVGASTYALSAPAEEEAAETEVAAKPSRFSTSGTTLSGGGSSAGEEGALPQVRRGAGG